MTRIVASLLAAAVLGALVVLPAGAAAPKLLGMVGPGYSIKLTRGAAKIASLKAGKYAITISDRSSSHDFHLFGPGVNKKTSIGGTGTKTWTVALRKGVYRFVCDAHPTLMKGSFKVG